MTQVGAWQCTLHASTLGRQRSRSRMCALS